MRGEECGVVGRVRNERSWAGGVGRGVRGEGWGIVVGGERRRVEVRAKPSGLRVEMLRVKCVLRG